MTFGQRLNKAMRAGNLTVADLARWFDAPYQTVRGWVLMDYEPSGGELDRRQVHALCDRLEKLTTGGPIMLVGMSRSQRIARLQKLRRKIKA